MVPGDGQIMSNLRRGALEYCILALIRDEERYGLDIARELADGVLMAGEGTLYPLLARLRKGGLVASSWQESESGPPRRYYRLTPDGRAALDAFEKTWPPFRDAVDRVVAPGRG
ncbi:PadR family transcriptional regulator [Jiangella gansuensis]|uniref:PadR family transcriptional regulator n=1 Tax=Jiangella gansuensis TaxID=281473 RepID=UPI00047B0C9A